MIFYLFISQRRCAMSSMEGYSRSQNENGESNKRLGSWLVVRRCASTKPFLPLLALIFPLIMWYELRLSPLLPPGAASMTVDKTYFCQWDMLKIVYLFLFFKWIFADKTRPLLKKILAKTTWLQQLSNIVFLQFFPQLFNW